MDPEDQDAPEVLETPDEVAAREADEAAKAAEEAASAATEETADEKIARLETEKADLESKNKQLFERTKKAKPSDGLTVMDGLTLAKADVHEEDLDTVTQWAKFKGVSVSEALKDKDLKVVLDTHQEERRTAQATTTGSGRGSSKVTGEQLLDAARRTGEVPETDEGMAKLAAAREAALTRKKEHKT